jgi:hypothetical protein
MANPEFKKTILIGPGGAGQQILLNVKRLLLDTFGAVPPSVKMLSLDTDSAQSSLQSAVSEQVYRFGPEEYFHLTVPELAIAIGVKGGNIQTVLVESETEVKAPPSIGHIQWLDMHDWKERRAGDEAAWEDWYRGKLSEIVRVIESDESRRFAGEIRTLAEHLRPISSDARISQFLRKPMVGRAWLFEAIDKWRGGADRSSRLLWITGPPGVGKSACAAHLAHYGRDKVLAAQFCEYDKPDHRDAQRIVQTLAFQLATRLPDFRKLLLTLPELSELDKKTPAELFDYLLTDPLRHTIDGGRERHLIVIDALDEASKNGQNALAEMLARNAQNLPDWIGIVATSRPEDAVTAPLQGLNPLLIDTTTESNRVDIRNYVLRELASVFLNRPDAAGVVEQILDKSEGVFLYVVFLCDEIRRDSRLLDHPDQFPKGMGGVFWQFFERQFPLEKTRADIIGFDLKDYRRRCRPILEMIVAAQEPLRPRFLARASGWDEYERNDVMSAFGSLLNVTKGRVQLFHKSLRDWLSDSSKAGPYFIDLHAGHTRLSEACWLEFASTTERVSWYARKHFQTHFDRIGEVQKKRAIEAKLRSLVRFVGVYICSSFRDMHGERDYLVKFVFPQLRTLCESRGVTWVDVDLRWGITAEESASGKVVSIVMDEIGRCRPFFIGLLGERYGYVPQELPAELIASHPWVLKYPRVSVQELEIIHGVLRDEYMFEYGLMYFRDPRYTEQLPQELRDDFVAQSPEARARMDHLKQRIRDASDEDICLLRENYRNPEELGRWVLDDFSQFLKTFLPDLGDADPLSQEIRQHDAFAQSRARNYLTRRPYFEALDMHVASQGLPLVVTGERGAGISALLARWFLDYREKHPNEIVLGHFTGATPNGGNVASLLRRIMLELNRRLLLQADDHAQPERIRAAFPVWLLEVANRGRIVLLIDGLDQLADGNWDPDLAWLPRTLPSTCRVILSTLPGRCLDATRRRGWPELAVHPLVAAERRAMIESLLSQYGKRLSPLQVARIASAEQASDQLFLQLMLDELRQFGYSERLDEQIDQWLAATNVNEVYERILSRLEHDYGSDLVRSSLSFIWAARSGLSETELFDLLGNGVEPLARAKCIPFFRAARSIIVERSNFLSFAHREVRDAVFYIYLSAREARQTAHHRLEEYFKAQHPTARALDELQWQREQLVSSIQPEPGVSPLRSDSEGKS